MESRLHERAATRADHDRALRLLTSRGPRASIIIPAHDEARTVGRLLAQISELGIDHDVLVVANGCTDATAEIVGSYPWCRLVEIGTASKIDALNAGDDAARAKLRVYLDADVSVSPDTLRALVDTIDRPVAIVASPGVHIDDRGASFLSRAYQRVWELTDYRLEDHTGSGVFGLSETGRARFGRFPAIISDDLYVRLLFSTDERRVSPGAPFTIHAPLTIRAQIRRLGRTMAGELQLADRYPTLSESNGGSRRARLLQRVVRRPRLWPAFAVYAFAYASGRTAARIKLARGRTDIWERDLTTR